VTGGCSLGHAAATRVVLRHRDGTLVRCVGCGLVRVEPMPSADAALSIYDAAYYRSDAGYRDYEGEERIFRAEFRRRLRRIAARARAGTLLDVGAATGAFLVEARRSGFVVRGVEPSPAAERARARGLDVFQGPVEAAALPAASIDVVTAFDVLEHLTDPVATLVVLRRALRPGGVLVVTVPDFGGWWARGSGSRWPFVTPKEHLHYFTRRTLRASLRAAGFDATTVGLAGTPVSFGSLARKGLARAGAFVERRLGRAASRGLSLPFGTLFAVATPRPDARGGERRTPTSAGLP